LRESSMFFLVRKACKKLQRRQLAMEDFTVALEMNSKDNNLTKAAIDRLEDEDDDELNSQF